MPVSIPCHTISAGHDVPILIRGKVPMFMSYRSAQQFLIDNGYAFDKDSGRPLGQVYECALQTAVERFGDVVAFEDAR